MSVVLPSTVEEINFMQNSLQYSQFLKDSNREEFSNIQTGKFKRLMSIPCPEGKWNDMPDFNAYLTFNDPNLVDVEVTHSFEDRLVPGEEQRPRSESISSVASSMDEKNFVYNNLGVKTFNTVCVDSGSTCISSDQSYVAFPQSVYSDLEPEETFLNLNPLLSQVTDFHNSDTTSSSISSAANSTLSDNLDYSVLSNFSMISGSSQDSVSDKLSSVSCKRSLDNDSFMTGSSPKRMCESPDSRFSDMRKKNNAASKNCRKTRKEKQKELEERLVELQKENVDLNKQIEYLAVMVSAYKKEICTIMRPGRLPHV